MPSRAVVSAAYTADRAAALAGVPRTTLYYWARTGLVVPAVAETRVKLWSYADLLVLRLVDWLRQAKPDDVEVARVSVKRIRQHLARTDGLGEQLLDRGLEVWVDHKGRLLFEDEHGMHTSLGGGLAQVIVDTKVNLVRPFEVDGMRGPDLVRPRPTLRIVPGKLSGEPHVEATRIPTQMLAALGRRGFDPAAIVEMYPAISETNVSEAIDLEVQLDENLRARAA
jgi:uncharacterized protein (DUF433 family)/DNA-binding transcriptional MerR regulator